MKTLSWMLTVLMLSFLLGCGGHGWTHSQRPQSEWDEDYLDCVQKAESEAGGMVGIDQAETLQKEGRVRYLVDQCMLGKGYDPPRR